MAIKIYFNGSTIYKPGGSGPSPDNSARYRLIGFITKLGVKTFMSRWPEYE